MKKINQIHQAVLLLGFALIFSLVNFQFGSARPLSQEGSGRRTSYMLHAGEYPYCIARRFDVDPDQLLAINHLTPWQNFPRGSFVDDAA